MLDLALTAACSVQPTYRSRRQHLAAASALLIVSLTANAQTPTTLPGPSRTAFKCVVAGKVSYSDAPCPDAQRIELQPTRGLDKSSGRTQIGADVRSEQTREQLSEAIKPLTGLTPAQFEVQRRRVNLPGASKAECSRLDRVLPELEQAAPPTSTTRDRAAAEQLLASRQRFRSLGC